MEYRKISEKFFLILYGLIYISIFPCNPTHSPENGLDPSWILSINLAIKSKLNWVDYQNHPNRRRYVLSIITQPNRTFLSIYINTAKLIFKKK